jgi:hypothetical protein
MTEAGVRGRPRTRLDRVLTFTRGAVRRAAAANARLEAHGDAGNPSLTERMNVRLDNLYSNIQCFLLFNAFSSISDVF